MDTLSSRHNLLTPLEVKVEGFDVFKMLTTQIFWKCGNNARSQPQRHKNIIMFTKVNQQLFFPKLSLQEAIILENHQGGLVGHFGRDKMLKLV